MSDFGNILNNLRAMSSVQLLFAFVACAGYALAQGGLFQARGARIAWLLAASGATGFVVLSPDWPAGVMLLAFAVAGIGCFVGAAWLLSRLVGLPTAGTSAPAVPTPADPGTARTTGVVDHAASARAAG